MLEITQFVDSDNNWGTGLKNPPARNDLFQSYIEDGTVISFDLIIAKSRGRRPREQKPFEGGESSNGEVPEDNVLHRISFGKEPAIVVATDKEYIHNPFDMDIEPETKKYTDTKSLCIVNKYSIFSRMDSNEPGVMVVAFPLEKVKYPHQSSEAVISILSALHRCLKGTQERQGKLRNALFMNIGARSGSSLVLLHAQMYMYSLTNRVGINEYHYLRAYRYNQELGRCLGCSLSHSKKLTVLDNSLDVQIELFRSSALTIWEDENVILRMSYAPLRYAHMRIFVRRHVSNLSELSENEIHSLGRAISLSDFLISRLLSKVTRTIPVNDRSIAFRQFTNTDFHMFVDILPVYMGMGGAELIVPLTIHSNFPEEFAQMMREMLEEVPDTIIVKAHPTVFD